MNTNNTIKVLKGPDRVRKRPAVIFTSDGIDGAIYAVKTLLDIFVTEAALGFSKELFVKVYKDDMICVKSFDRGFVLDETVIDGKPAWEYDFCELYSRPRNEAKDYHLFLSEEKNQNELYGDFDSPIPKYPSGDSYYPFALCCVQYVTDFMNVEAVHNNIRKQLNFKKGYSVSSVRCEPTNSVSYTQIEFKLDREVFSEISIPINSLSSILKYASMTIPGFKCSIKDEKTSEECTYLFRDGLLDYARTLTAGHKTTPFYIKEIEASGKERYNYKEYDARIKVVLAFSDFGGYTKCIHNYRPLEFGGNHLKAGVDKIKQILDWRIIRLGKQPDITVEDILNKLVILIETNCTDKASRWENATKKAITNKMITDMCIDLFDNDFTYFIEENKVAILSVVK